MRDPIADDELRSLLHSWRVAAPSQLDRRVLAAYRRRGPARLLSRAWNRAVPVPLPLLAGLLVVALGLGLALVRLRATPAAGSATGVAEAVQMVVGTRSLAGYRPLASTELSGPRPEVAR